MASPITGTTSVTLHDSVQLPRLYLAWPTPPDFSKEQAAFDVLSVILNSDDKFVIYELGKFLKIAFNRRSVNKNE